MVTLKKPIHMEKFLSVLTETLNQSPPDQTDRTHTTVHFLD